MYDGCVPTTHQCFVHGTWELVGDVVLSCFPPETQEL